MQEERDLVADALAISTEDLIKEACEETALEEREGFYLIPDDDIYPGINNVTKMKEVYREFMKGGELRKVAQDLNVDRRTALKWAERGQWMRRRNTVEMAAQEEDQQNIERLRLEHRQATLEKQIASSAELRRKIDEAMEDELSPGNVKQLAEASKAVADVEARALGLNESGLSAAQQTTKAKAEGDARRPLVLVVPGGGLPVSVRREKVVEKEDVIDVGEK